MSFLERKYDLEKNYVKNNILVIQNSIKELDNNYNLSLQELLISLEMTKLQLEEMETISCHEYYEVEKDDD